MGHTGNAVIVQTGYRILPSVSLIKYSIHSRYRGNNPSFVTSGFCREYTSSGFARTGPVIKGSQVIVVAPVNLGTIGNIHSDTADIDKDSGYIVVGHFL